MLQGGVLCKTGLKRRVNQDRAGLRIDGDTALCFVADGMGGHYAGERASGILSDLLQLWWARRHTEATHLPARALADEFRELVQISASRIQAATPSGQYCGSTIVLLWISAGQYLLLTAGDSRCYQVRPTLFRTGVEQISKDDVYHARGPRDAALEGKLTNAVGSQYEAACTIRTGTVEKNTLFALCSDGVYRYCDSAELARSWARAARRGEIETTLQQIDGLVCAHGAPDNYSLVLIQRK